jgi:DNA-binding transcriptional LysR family regulator
MILRGMFIALTRACRDHVRRGRFVSNALARLRVLFDDALFVKTPVGMIPTPRAQALAEPIQMALH